MEFCGIFWSVDYLVKNEGSHGLKSNHDRSEFFMASLYQFWNLEAIITEVMKRTLSTTKSRTEFIPSVALSHICLSMAWDVLGRYAAFDLVCN